MKDKLRVFLMIVLILVLVAMAGSFWFFVGKQAQIEKEREEALAIEAMYVEIGTHGDYMFVDLESETPFEAEFPKEQVFREDGQALSLEKIGSGDIFKIYGDGVMTKSVPAQYTGVTKMVRIHLGFPEDTEPYEELLEPFKNSPLYTPEEGVIAP